jgi:hypothetical protein
MGTFVILNEAQRSEESQNKKTTNNKLVQIYI